MQRRILCAEGCAHKKTRQPGDRLRVFGELLQIGNLYPFLVHIANTTANIYKHD